MRLNSRINRRLV